MEWVFDVTLADRSVGQVMIKKEGLYYLLECLFYPPETGKYRLIGESGNITRDFGFCVPVQSGVGWKTRFPVRQFPVENALFKVIDHHKSEEKLFIPIREDEPFAYLAIIEQSKLVIEQGRFCICINR